MSEGLLVNVVDMLDIITRSKAKAEATQDTELAECARSVLSALVLHLGKKHAVLPPEVRPCYRKLIGENND